MGYEFEKLRVWQAALAYDDLVCAFADALPQKEKFGLFSQLRRASSSIALNIAEGSTSQSDREKHRFLGYAIRSLLETVAGQLLAARRGYPIDPQLGARAYEESQTLFRQLQAFRTSVATRIRRNDARRRAVSARTHRPR